MDKTMLNQVEHIVGRIQELAAISETASGITRRYGTPAAGEAGNKVLDWMRRAGLQTRIDAIGNIRGRWLSDNPAAKTLVIASHLDTVVNAGRWDGPLGVVTGLEIIENLIRRKMKLSCHIELIAFCDEEGVRFHTTYLGSRVVAGNFDPRTLQYRDQEGITLAEAIVAAGGNTDDLSAEAIPAEEWLGYFELHIEQGPILYNRKIPVAVVKAIAGQVRGEVIFTGMAGHAGTVPMAMRQDALCGAAEFILAAEGEATTSGGLLATIGKLWITDPASNVIPGQVGCSIDIRSADEHSLQTGQDSLKAIAEAIGARRGLTVQWQVIQSSSPVSCDDHLKDILSRAIKNAGYEVLELVSGAGHDAVPVSAIAPVSMLFVRCFKGISHNPLEDVEPSDLAAALAVAEDFIINITKG
jgi:allantoate deiminase